MLFASDVGRGEGSLRVMNGKYINETTGHGQSPKRPIVKVVRSGTIRIIGKRMNGAIRIIKIFIIIQV